MAYTELERLTEIVRNDLEGYFGNRRTRRREALQWLLELLMTARVPEALEALARSGEVRGLRTHLRVLSEYLREQSKLPEALCARYKYRLSESRACRQFPVRQSAWGYVHRLARDADRALAIAVPQIAYASLDWHDALEERFVNVEAVLETHALEGMLVSALEAYLSPRPQRRKGYEVYGVNLGMTRDVPHTSGPSGTRVTRYVSVMRSQPQLSADGQYEFVEPNRRSLDAILTVTQLLHPHYQAVGHFHSHPYDDFTDLERREGWLYSASDEEINRDFAAAMANLHQRICTTFIVGICRSPQSVIRSHYRGLANTIQLSVGNCRVILAAYRSLGSGRLTRSNIRLALAGVVG